MIEILIDKVIPGVARLTLWISVGVVLGAVLEAIGLVKRIAAISRPVVKLVQLPPIAASAFVTAFVSPKSGNAMLSAAFANREISRRSLVLSAAANSFPSTLMHLKISGPLLISMLGIAGACYVGFVIAGGCAVLLATIVAGRIWRENDAVVAAGGLNAADESNASGTWKRAWKRWKRLLPRVLLVSIPLYTIVAWMNAIGLFKQISKHLPACLDNLLPPEAMAILAIHMTGATRAAPVAREFLDSGEISASAVCLTLIVGYGLTLPVRVLRRTLPSTLSLFPGRNGFLIIALTQFPRLVLAVATVVIWMVVHGGMK